jgi:hypothetical protein
MYHFGAIQAVKLNSTSGNAAGTFKAYVTNSSNGSNVFLQATESEVVFNEDSGSVVFRVEGDGNANLFYIDAANDRVGIGSNNPHSTFDVKTSTDGRILFADNSGDPDIIAVNNANSAYANLKLEGNTIVGRISGNERFKIDANGNTLVRENDIEGSASSTVALQIGNATNNDVIHSRNKTSSGAVYHLFMKFDNMAPDDNSSYFINARDNSTLRFVVYSDGDVQNHDNSYSGISDEKLKEQIKDASSQWDDIKALKIRKYKMKEEIANKGDSDNLWKLGVVAQEVEALGMSGLVTTNKDVDDETKEDLGTTTKAVKYSILYMKAVKALQEAMTRIETLEAKVAKLEGE